MKKGSQDLPNFGGISGFAERRVGRYVAASLSLRPKLEWISPSIKGVGADEYK